MSSNENLQNDNPDNSPDDTMKILVATDIHLGFDHRKKRGEELEDSFITFEEILQYSRELEVDFILLGGDLFHDAKPSQPTILRCMELLRKYCLGPREIKVQFLSDPEVIFRHCSYKTINYEDPNLNVSMPVFSIHGNHDDPNFGAIGSMDLLSVSGLLNYFGKWTDLTKIVIPPLVIKKGNTHVALYGLSYINDQRLSRLLRDFKVDMLRPVEIPDCFNIFVLHQNRAKHSEYGHIPENKFPNFLNLVIWGHEHECRITPEFIPETEYFISQPGSSIATSLSESEARLKHVGLLSINKTKFKMQKLRLKTVRPFVFDNLILHGEELQENYAKSLSDSVYNFVNKYIENELVPKAAEQLTGHSKQPIQPLLRLRVFYSCEEEMFDTIKLAQIYCDEVANPMDIVLFRKEKSPTKKTRSMVSNMMDDTDDIAQVLSFDDDEDTDWCRTVQSGIRKKFETAENKNLLQVLSLNGLNLALQRFIEKNDPDAFGDILKHQMKRAITSLKTENIDSIEDIDKEIKSFREKRNTADQDDPTDVQELCSSIDKSGDKDLDFDIGEHDDTIDKSKDIVPKGATKGTSRGRGSRGRGRGRGAGKNTLDVTVTSTSAKGSKQTKKKDQYTLQSFMGSSSQNKPATKNIFILDSD